MKAGWIAAVCVWLCADRMLAQNLNNFDVQEPVLRFSPAAGQDEDLFGYAVTAHQIETLDAALTDPADIMQDALAKTRIIIGAPKGTFPGGLPLDDPGMPRADQTGLVFNCPLAPGVCEGVRGNDNANVDDDDGLSDGRLFDHRPPALLPRAPGLPELPSENKTGQLLGAFLMSTGDNLLVCAPRWTTLVTQGSLPHGRCYFTDRDLTNVRLLQPCTSGRPIEAVGQAYCTAGTGAVMTDDLIAVGAPGFDQLSGVVYYTDDFTGSSVGAEMVEGNAFTPNATGSLVEINDIYTAFRVVSGQIANARGAGRPNIIATVPRYNQTEGKYGRVNVYDVPSPPVLGDDSFLMAFGEGQQIGEFFGYSVIAIDLDGDNYDDIVVGAPMYSDIDQARVESGRVYIFRNLRNSTLASEPVILPGQVSRGRFGSSLTSLGDVDNDGYEDFAVGAPYATNTGTNDTGTVFIYYGRGDISRIPDQEPFEVTAAEMVSQLDGLDDLKTFGWSLSGGVDVDANGYNDLVIGAYESQAVFVIRSIPVADVYVELEATLPIAGRINLEGGTTCLFSDGIRYPCFPLTIRGNYTGQGLSEPLTITYTLREVVSSVQRMFFDMPGRPNELTGTLTFDTIGQEFTSPDINVLVFTREEISSLDTPLRLEIEVEQISRPESMGDGNQTLASLSDFPRVRQRGDPQIQVTLLTNCGAVCNADLDLQSVTTVFQNRDGSGTREGFDADAVGSVDFTLEYANIAAQDAINNELSFVIPDIFETTVISAAECTLTGRNVLCDLRDILTQRDGPQTVSIILTVDPSIVLEHNTQVDITFTISTIVSQDTDPSNNMRPVTLNIAVRADIFVTFQFATSAITYQQGLTNFPTERTTVDDLGMMDAVLNVTVGNDGPSIIRNAQLTIFFPAAIGDIFYLYPFDTLIPSQDTTLSCDFSAINPDNLEIPVINSGNGRRRSVTSLKHKRRRREAIAALSRKPRQTTNNPITVLDCATDMDLCAVIRCDIMNLATEASLDIFARVNEGFFTNQDEVFFLTAYSNVSITSTLEELTELPNNALAQIVLTPPRAEDDDGNLIHAIIWPILGGLLLFVVFVLLLYFCGFFRRKKKPEDEVAEGDFDPNKFNVQPVESKKEVEATTL